MGKVMISDLAAMLMEQYGLGRREAQRFVETMVDIIQDGVEKDKLVKIRNLGTFKVVEVEARESVSVNNGKRVTIEGHSKLTFTPDNTMKELVNKPFSQFETVVLNDGVDFDEQPVVEEPDIVEEPEVTEHPTVVEQSSVAEHPIAVEQSSVAEHPTVVEQSVVAEHPTVVELSEMDKQAVESPLPTPEVLPIEGNGAEPVADENEYEGADENETPRRRSHWWMWLLLALLMGACGFVAGYYIGQQKAATMPLEPVLPEQPQQTDSVSAEQQLTNSIDSFAESDSISVDTVLVDTINNSPKQDSVKVEEAEPDYKKYEAMDTRVRTGAYHIVGTAQVVKARAGDNTRRLAKRYLGDGMECYIEVYNGITASTPLEEGQDIKIPELKWKKKAKKN